MIYDIVPIIIIFFSLAILIYIFIKRLPQLANINLEEIPKEKQAKVKKEILRKRFKKRLKEFFEKLVQNLHPWTRKLTIYYQNFRKKIRLLEKKLISRQRRIIQEKPEKINELVSRLIKEGEELFEKSELAEAEKKFIDVLSLDSSNRQAYQNLGKIYLAKKNYPYALETFKYLLLLDLKKRKILKRQGKDNEKKGALEEIDKRLAETYFDIAQIYFLNNELEKAQISVEKSLKLAPHYPKYLDFFCEVSIILKDKLKAKRALSRLRKVNPENKKLEEFKKQIEEI